MGATPNKERNISRYAAPFLYLNNLYNKDLNESTFLIFIFFPGFLRLICRQSLRARAKVNTLIGTKGLGLTSGYYPGATYLMAWSVYSFLFSKRSGICHQPIKWWRMRAYGYFDLPVRGK